MNDKLKELGFYIKEARIKKNITAYNVEKNFGISRSFWSRIENGKNGKTTPDILKQIAQILDINYMELYKIVGYVDDKTIKEYVIKQKII